MTQTPAGWYDDGSGRQRYWDGAIWTEHFADTYVAPAAPVQHPGFGPAQTYARPPTSDGRDGLGYAVPGASTPDALADPFAAPPRQQGYQTTASGPRKRMPGWAIALIIGGVVLVIGAIVAAVFVVTAAVDGMDEAFGDAVEGFNDETSVPADLESAYWELDEAYRADSCEELQALTTDHFIESQGIDPVDCAGAFSIDEDAAAFYSYVESGQIDGDTATVDTYFTYTDDGQEYYGDANYTLVWVDGEWLFDSAEYVNY